MSIIVCRRRETDPFRFPILADLKQQHAGTYSVCELAFTGTPSIIKVRHLRRVIDLHSERSRIRFDWFLSNNKHMARITLWFDLREPPRDDVTPADMVEGFDWVPALQRPRF